MSVIRQRPLAAALRLPIAAANPLALILAVAFLLRVGLILLTPHFQPNNDPADYDFTARSIAHGHGYPPTSLAAPGTASALRPPGYPYFLAALYATFGHSYFVGRLANAILGVVVVLLVWAIGRCLWGGHLGIIAAVLAAVAPPLIALNGSLLSEPLFLVLELGAVVAVLKYQQGGSRLVHPLIGGILCGAAVLTRSVGLALLLPLVLGLLMAPRLARRQRLYAVAAFVTASCLVIAPWTIRNAVAFHGAFIPVSTQDGITAAGTFNSEAANGPLEAVWRPPYLVAAFQHLFRDSIDEAEMDRILRDDALNYAFAHPGYVAAATGLDTLRLLNVGPNHRFVSHLWYHEMGIPQPDEIWISVAGDLIIALAIAGSVLVFSRRKFRSRGTYGFVWLVPLLLYAVVVPIHGGFRYRAPVDPFLVLLAAYAIASAFARVGSSDRWLASV